MELPNVEKKTREGLNHVVIGTARSVTFRSMMQTLSTKVYGETFKIKSESRNCDSQKVVCPFKCKKCDKARSNQDLGSLEKGKVFTLAFS